MKSVIVTGGSSLIGLPTGLKFLESGWKVLATTTSGEHFLDDHSRYGDRLKVYALDLKDSNSIRSTIARILAEHGTIDVLVNNAGVVLSGPFEATSQQQVREQMEVNFFGATEMMRGLIPHFRERGSGTFINISSISGAVTFPLFSMYHASKWALEGFSESLYHELKPFGIKVRIVQPGGVNRESYDNRVAFADGDCSAYEQMIGKVHRTNWYPSFSSAQEVAETVLSAAIDPSPQLRYSVGEDCRLFLNERASNAEDEGYLRLMEKRILNND